MKKSPKPRGRPPLRLSESHDDRSGKQVGVKSGPNSPELDNPESFSGSSSGLKKRRGRPPGSKNKPKNMKTPDCKKKTNVMKIPNTPSKTEPYLLLTPSPPNFTPGQVSSALNYTLEQDKPGLSYGLAQLGSRLDDLTRTSNQPRRLSESSESGVEDNRRLMSPEDGRRLKSPEVLICSSKPSISGYENEFLKHMNQQTSMHEGVEILDDDLGDIAETVEISGDAPEPILERVQESEVYIFIIK